MTKNEVVIPDGTDEERALYMAVIKKFGLKVVEDKTPKVILGKEKVIKIEIHCTLCEIPSVKYIRMLKYTNGIWKNDKYITKEEANKILESDLRKDFVACCHNCEAFLMEKDKIELVRMITRSKSSILINKTTKKKKGEEGNG